MTFPTARAGVNAIGAAVSPLLSQGTSRRLFKAAQSLRYDVGVVISPQQSRMFWRDAGMGAQSMQFDKHCAEHQLSTDTSSVVRKIFKFDGDKYKEACEAFKVAYKEVYKREPYSEHEFLGKHPWDLLKFADRKQIENPDKPYVDYYRQATNTSIDRGGKMHFFLGKFSVREYVESIVLAENREKKPFSEIAATISWPTLVQLDKGEQFDFYLGCAKERADDFVKQPTITTVELYDSTAGEFSEKGKDFKYFAENDELLDTGKLLKLQQAALDEARTPENVERLTKGEPMTQKAQEALERFQQYIVNGGKPDAQAA